MCWIFPFDFPTIRHPVHDLGTTVARHRLSFLHDVWVPAWQMVREESSIVYETNMHYAFLFCIPHQLLHRREFNVVTVITVPNS